MGFASFSADRRMQLVMRSTLLGSRPPLLSFGFKFFCIVTINGVIFFLELDFANVIDDSFGCGRFFPNPDTGDGDKLLSPR